MLAILILSYPYDESVTDLPPSASHVLSFCLTYFANVYMESYSVVPGPNVEGYAVFCQLKPVKHIGHETFKAVSVATRNSY